MKLLSNERYQQEIQDLAESTLDWNCLKDSSVLITGATGTIASYLIDVLMIRNQRYGLNCRIYALGRSEAKAHDRFETWLELPLFHFVKGDVNEKLELSVGTVDYFIHAASNPHPVAYATDPIGTITANVIGLKNILDLAAEKKTKRGVFLSSVEIYGENRGDTDLFPEDYCGYIDCNTLRAGYPESKRVGEALCQAYIKQKQLDIVIPRLARIYGPTLQKSDSKALSQFLRNAVTGEDIVLKSRGTQYYSYLYVADAVSAVLTCLMKGGCGEAYNISSLDSDIRLRDLAALIASSVNRQVVFQLPDEIETAGFSKATLARLDNTKLCALGWKPKYSIQEGVQRTIMILRESMETNG